MLKWRNTTAICVPVSFPEDGQFRLLLISHEQGCSVLRMCHLKFHGSGAGAAEQVSTGSQVQLHRSQGCAHDSTFPS